MSDSEVTEETTQPPVLGTASAVPETNGLEDSDEPKPKPAPERDVQDTVPGLTSMLNQWEIRGVPEERTFFSNDVRAKLSCDSSIKFSLFYFSAI